MDVIQGIYITYTDTTPPTSATVNPNNLFSWKFTGVNCGTEDYSLGTVSSINFEFETDIEVRNGGIILARYGSEIHEYIGIIKRVERLKNTKNHYRVYVEDYVARVDESIDEDKLTPVENETLKAFAQRIGVWFDGEHQYITPLYIPSGVNENYIINSNWGYSGVTKRDVQRWICQLQGLNLGGVVDFEVDENANASNWFAPTNPTDQNVIKEFTPNNIKSIDKADYMTQSIDKIWFGNDNSDVGLSYGTGKQALLIPTNPLINYDDTSFLQPLYEKVSSLIPYTPMRIETFVDGNTDVIYHLIHNSPSDQKYFWMSYTENGTTYYCPIFNWEVSQSGIILEGKGSPDRNSTNSYLGGEIANAGKYNKFTRTLDETKSEIGVIKRDYATKTELSQTADQIISTVSATQTRLNVLPQIYFRENESGSPYTHNGITWTVNKDGSITADGTAIGGAIYYVTGFELDQDIPVVTIDPEFPYTLSGCPAGGSDTTYDMYLRVTPEGTTPTQMSGTLYRDQGSGVTAPAGFKYAYVAIAIYANQTVNNLTFYPLLEQGDTVRPYISAREGIGGLSARMASAESSITQNATEIASKVSTTDYNGNTIASLINQTSTTITIDAQHINLNGAVTFSDLNSNLQGEINDKTDSSDVTTIIGNTVNAAYINALEINAKKIVATYTKTFRHQDYSSSDYTTIQMLARDKNWTAADLDRYDINMDGQITNADLVKVRNMVNNGRDETATIKTEIDPSKVGNPIAIYANGATTPGASMNGSSVRGGAGFFNNIQANTVNAPYVYVTESGNSENYIYLYGSQIDFRKRNGNGDYLLGSISPASIVIDSGTTSTTTNYTSGSQSFSCWIDWDYRKWGDGTYECWGKANLYVASGQWANWGSVRSLQSLTPHLKYPVTFLSAPHEQVTACSSDDDWGFWVSAGANPGCNNTKTTTARYQLIRGLDGSINDQSSVPMRLEFYVRGKVSV